MKKNSTTYAKMKSISFVSLQEVWMPPQEKTGVPIVKLPNLTSLISLLRILNVRYYFAMSRQEESKILKYNKI